MVSDVVKRVKLSFAPGLEVEFSDRDRAIKQVYELGEKGTRTPVVVYGPEGCGKSAWLNQAVEVLKEQGFDVIYVNILQKEHIVYTDVKEVIGRISEVVADTTGYTPIKLADLVILLANQLLKRWRKKKIALLVDEVFQAIGVDKAEIYVKMLLNLIEYPPEPYENIVIIVATSEGLSRWRIGRHRWGWLTPMWNMSRKGFEELYERIPGPKPSFEDVWRLAGGNPYMLGLLYRSSWDVNTVTSRFVEWKRLTQSFVNRWRKVLEEAVEDPDTLWSFDADEEPVKELVERNLIVYFLSERNSKLWVDEPPPEKNLEIGVGKHVAWQTPLHREAVREALEKYMS
uniref:ATPase n=1 Tax=Ignisphaera aggregans TaxID=334771 RepID=A0A7J2T9E3_9CREN